MGLTDRQREFWRLYDAGNGPAAIARMVHPPVTASTVSAGMRASAAAMGRPWPLPRRDGGNGGTVTTTATVPASDDPDVMARAIVARYDARVTDAIDAARRAADDVSSFIADPSAWIAAETERRTAARDAAVTRAVDAARAWHDAPADDDARRTRDRWAAIGNVTTTPPTPDDVRALFAADDDDDTDTSPDTVVAHGRIADDDDDTSA